MSYRGSFVTEYIYCEACAAAVKESLAGYDLASPVESGSIIAGYVSDMSSSEALNILVDHLATAKLCEGHDVLMALIPEGETRSWLTLRGPRKSSRTNILANSKPLKHK